MMVKVWACSERVMDKGMGPPLRGLVHSAFTSAANLMLSDGFLISLNASTSTRPPPQEKYYHQNENDQRWTKNLENFLSIFDHFHFDEREIHSDSSMKRKNFPNFFSSSNYLSTLDGNALLMPNGMLLDAGTSESPFVEMRVGMPVIFGAGRLVLDAIGYVLEFANCPRWNPRMEHPANLNMALVRANGEWLAQFCRRKGRRYIHQSGMDALWTDLPLHERSQVDEPILALAEKLCGRGPGLTPGGDDFLAGWMAAGWLLMGPQPDFLATCQQVCQIARTRTHTLSRCWLEYAAAGDVASPVHDVLTALAGTDRGELQRAARGLFAVGATSGWDLLQGILHFIREDKGNTKGDAQ